MATKLYGLVGHPVRHSLSPAMQNAAFEALGIDAEYKLFDVPPSGLAEFFRGIPDNSISGINITIPHKIKAKEYLEKNGLIDENAIRLGAVNTVKVTLDGLKGFNTDGPGFYRSLVEDLKFEPENKTVFFMGAGGAAVAIIMYLGNGPAKIFVHDIENGKAKEVWKQYSKFYDPEKLSIVDKTGFEEALEASDLLVNATPVGMKESDPSPVDKSLLHSGLYIYDLIYNVTETALVKEALRMKRHAVTGLGMLLRQGAIAFEIWTGQKAPVDIMKKALKTALKAR
ncbi:MAG: shikimate dehydrogenase [Candidatus Omnitrophica bacterium]|nr:shikimate dehydrogenase [Candidatus Omnitrophota bacterium]